MIIPHILKYSRINFDLEIADNSIPNNLGKDNPMTQVILQL